MDTTSGASILKTITFSVVLASMVGACSTLSTTDVAIAAADNASGVEQGSSVEHRHAGVMNLREHSDLVYKILSAEIAGRRGRVDIAAQNYFDAATSSGDSRVAERAVKLAMYARDWPQAGTAVDRWVELAPESVDAWQHKAQISLQQKDVDAATSALEKIVDVSEEPAGDVIPGLVSSLLQQTDAQLGTEVLSRLGKRFPQSADAQYGIGRFAMSRGDRNSALEAFERALEIDPENVEALLSRARLKVDAGEGDESLGPVEKYLVKNPDNAPARLGFARLLVETGQYERAAEQFDEISERFPDQPESIFAIGLLALEIKRPEQAEKYLEQVVELGVHAEEANYYLGRISDSRKDYRKAIERYKQVEGGDNFLDAQIRSAELYGLIGEIEQGREMIANLRTLTEDQNIQVELINSESRMLNSNDLEVESLQVLTEGLQKYPDNSSLLYSRALVAERLDKTSIFEADLLKVINTDPDNGYALNALGYFLVDRNERLDEAETYLTRAIELQPDDAAIIDSVGWLYYRQGKYDEAIEMLRRAHKVLPDAEIAAHLGEVLWVSGDQSGATLVWEEALKTAPDDETLTAVMKKFLP